MKPKPKLTQEQLTNMKQLAQQLGSIQWAEDFREAYEEYLNDREAKIFTAQELLAKFFGLYDEL